MKVRIEGLLVAAALSAAAAPTTLPKKRVLVSLDEVGLVLMLDGGDGDGEEADDDDHQ